MIGNWYEIEELIPAERAVGGVAYWHPLHAIEGYFRYQEHDLDRAMEALQKTREIGLNTRLVKITKEIVE